MIKQDMTRCHVVIKQKVRMPLMKTREGLLMTNLALLIRHLLEIEIGSLVLFVTSCTGK